MVWALLADDLAGIMLDLEDVDAERRAAVAIDLIVAAELAWQRPREHRRPAALSAREALAALQFEASFVAVAASNLASGTPLARHRHRGTRAGSTWTR